VNWPSGKKALEAPELQIKATCIMFALNPVNQVRRFAHSLLVNKKDKY